MLTAIGRRLQLLRSARDAGVTLMELMVAMGLSVIIGALTMQLFVNVSDSTAAITDRTINSSSARNAMGAWTSYLQVADGPTAGSTNHRFEWITGTDLAFYANLNTRSGTAAASAPVRIWLRLDSANQLVEEQFRPTGSTYPTAPTTCRILAQNVSSTALFTPVSSGTGTDFGQAPANMSAGCQPLALPTQNGSVDTNQQTVTAIGIGIVLRDAQDAHPIEFQTVVTLPTLGGQT